MSIFIQFHVLKAPYFLIELYPDVRKGIGFRIISVPLTFMWVS